MRTVYAERRRSSALFAALSSAYSDYESSALPSVDAIRKTRRLYRLSDVAASRIEKQVRKAFEGWENLARSMGIQRRELQRLEAVIDPVIDA